MAKTRTVKTSNNEALNEYIEETPSYNSELDNAFDNFEKEDAEFTPDQPDEPEQEQPEQKQQEQKTIDPNEKFVQDMKAKFLVGLFMYLLAGMNTFLMNKINGTEVPMELMEMSEQEKNSVSHYVQTPEIMEWLNKLPTWLIGVLHVEYIFLRKFNAVKKDYKKNRVTEETIEQQTT